MRITALFLDMDGILADFATPAYRLHGGMGEYNGPYEPWDHLGITADEFWQPIVDAGVGFWETLPRLPHADEWISLCKNSGRPWCILTRVTVRNWEAVAVGKQRWLKRMYGSAIAERIVPCCDKSLHSGVGKMLIDDCDENCEAWAMQGGEAIRPNRPWNVSRYSDEGCIEIAKELLRR